MAATAGDDYLEINLRMWDERVPIHVRSPFYDNDSFKAGRNALPPIEVEEMGDVRGRTLLHLQCHFGQDTLSWARLGARVTGLDFSPTAIDEARKLAADIGVDDAEFVCADVYSAREALHGRRFDIVYTGAGAIIWLPDINRWAEVVADSLVTGGVFYMREFHPLVTVFDDEVTEPVLRQRYWYFHSEPYAWDEPGTYADPGAPTRHNLSYEWLHTIGDIVSALAGAGLRIEFLHEFDYTTFKHLPFLVQAGRDHWRLPGQLDGAIPLMYTIRATKA
ncbi:MAG: class I SAM-dependent methyltransferase [Dehalococcoidia bacterium]